MFKTFEKLKSYSETMEQTEAYIVGPSHQGHQRAVYQIGVAQILIDTVFPYNPFKPSEEWYWTGDYMTEAEAQAFAEKYNARVVDAYYSDTNEKQLMFDELDDLLRWLWDNKREQINTQEK